MDKRMIIRVWYPGRPPVEFAIHPWFGSGYSHFIAWMRGEFRGVIGDLRIVMAATPLPGPKFRVGSPSGIHLGLIERVDYLGYAEVVVEEPQNSVEQS